MKEKLVTHRDDFVNTIMNERYYVYDIVLAPNPSDDSVSAFNTLEELGTSTDLQEKLAEFLPDFDLTYHMTAREIIREKPRFRKRNFIKVQKLTQDSAKIKVKMWD